MAAGYSSNPLYKKLGLKEGHWVKVIHPPAGYKDLLAEISGKLVFKNKDEANLDLIHFFTNSTEELEEVLPCLKSQIKKNGAIWVSWYKKSAGKPVGITENIIRCTALAIGLVDMKVCAVDENWSALKLVFRLADR
ncbi:MAG: DUF3052 family protein [Chitinophagales bacterium]